MKSTITKKLEIQNVIEFPALMTPKSDPDTIFLMKSKERGIVVCSKNVFLPVGLDITSTGFRYGSMSLFDGAITLQND